MNRRYLLLKPYQFPRSDSVCLSDLPESVPRLTRQRMYRKVFRRAYRSGWAQGEASGRKYGIQNGQSYGFEQGQKEGSAKGYQQGFDQGLKDGTAEREQQYQLMTLLWEQLQREHDENWDRLQQQLAGLIEDICRKVVMEELKTSQESLMALVQQSLEFLPKVKSLEILVHPDNRPVMEKFSSRFPEEWKIVTDPSVTAGGCIVKADSGTADAQVETRLSHYLDEVNSVIRNHNEIR